MISGQISEENYFDANRKSWDARTAIHEKSKFYDLEGFLGGKNLLNSIKLEALGDVQGKSLLHLQCHFGLDSLCWSRLGAKVTGVDFSEKAITIARDVNVRASLDARFICANIYDLRDHLSETFDIVFTSYGVIGWLPDLDRWASIVSRYLKPGGTFYMAEFHQVVWMFDDEFTRIDYSYFNKDVITTEQNGTYTDRDAVISSTEYGWNHSIAEVFGSLHSHGLEILAIEEFDYSPYNCFLNMVSDGKSGYYIKGFEGKLPMVYSVKAVKGEG
ncbi:MAG: class I SAM-dependent methyltransferase [Cyclobacteriaceae bacterium]|nr:class I SAM-dependent methyltransferase [Cyclobacteriaceae bacterium]